MSDTPDEELERCKQRVGTTLLGKWRLDALLGIGGMAAVYAASHRIGRRDAVKILHPYVAFSKELRARFEQEAEAVSRLGHPATVQVLDIETADDGAPFMVMELLEGESLGQRAYRGDVPEMELLGYVDTLLDVLERAHSIGIVHRDIKPDNLFVTRDGRLKVLDFGIARMREGTSNVQTRTGAMLGTTAYMAPEQIHGRAIDGRVDIFAVGATLFRILAKRRIHEGATDAAVLIAMGSTPAPALASVAPHVDPRVAAIVDRALAFDRDRRYADARTMREDVRAVLRGDAPSVARASGASAAASVATVSGPIPSPPPSVAAVSIDATVAATMAAPPHVSILAANRPGSATIAGWGTSATYVPELTGQRRERNAAWMVGLAALLVCFVGAVTATWLYVGRASAEATANARDLDDDDDTPSKKSSPAPSATPSALEEDQTEQDDRESDPPSKPGPRPGEKPKPKPPPPKPQPEEHKPTFPTAEEPPPKPKPEPPPPREESDDDDDRPPPPKSKGKGRGKKKGHKR